MDFLLIFFEKQLLVKWVRFSWKGGSSELEGKEKSVGFVTIKQFQKNFTDSKLMLFN